MNFGTRQHYIKGIIAGIIVFILGFGIMNLFWLLNKTGNDLLGLYDYRAATIGDGIFLPMLIGSTVCYIAIGRELTKKEKWISYAIGVIFAIYGIITQVSWLHNKNIVLNWTIPEAYHFTFAGWYHALFFVAMFYAVGMLMTKVWIIRCSPLIKNEKTFEILYYTIIWFSGLGFINMFILDNYSNKWNYSLLLIVTYVIYIIFFVVFSGLSIKFSELSIKYIFNDFVCILSGASAALGIGFIVMGKVDVPILFSMILTLFSVSFVIPNAKKIKLMLIYIFLITLPTCSLSVALSFSQMNIYVGILVVLIPCLIAYAQKTNIEYYNQEGNGIQKKIVQGGMLYTIVIFSMYMVSINPKDSTGIINALVGLALSAFVQHSITNNFKRVIEAEEECNNATECLRRQAKEHQRKTKLTSYLLIVPVAIACLIYIAVTLSSYVEMKTISSILISPIWTIKNTIALFLLIFFTVIIILQKNVHLRNVKKQEYIFLILLFIITYVILAINIFTLRHPFFKIHFTNIFSIFMVLGSSIFIAEGFYANIISIRGLAKDSFTVVTSIIIFCGNFIVMLFAIMPATSDYQKIAPSLVLLLISFIGIIFSCVILPFFMCRIVEREIIETRVESTVPISGVLQDGFIVSMLFILGGCVPSYFSMIAQNNWEVITGIALIITNIYWPLTYCLKNNVKHLSQQIESYSIELNNENFKNDMLYKRIHALSIHIYRQNILAFISLLMYSLPFFFLEMIIFVSSEGDGTCKKFMKQYIPDIYSEGS